MRFIDKPIYWRGVTWNYGNQNLWRILSFEMYHLYSLTSDFVLDRIFERVYGADGKGGWIMFFDKKKAAEIRGILERHKNEHGTSALS